MAAELSGKRLTSHVFVKLLPGSLEMFCFLGASPAEKMLCCLALLRGSAVPRLAGKAAGWGVAEGSGEGCVSRFAPMGGEVHSHE